MGREGNGMKEAGSLFLSTHPDKLWVAGKKAREATAAPEESRSR